jgi:hypothetical protein
MPNDLKALAALIDAERAPFDPAKLALVRMPVLIVVGSNDNAIGKPEPLARMIPGAQLVMLEGRDPHDGARRSAIQGGRARILGWCAPLAVMGAMRSELVPIPFAVLKNFAATKAAGVGSCGIRRSIPTLMPCLSALQNSIYLPCKLHCHEKGQSLS